jgi:4-alpha-glucanotransferase
LTKLLKYPDAINDINRVVKSYPTKTIGMGYGKNYELSFYRPSLIFFGNPYLLDAASMMEMQQSGINHIPPDTLAALRECQTNLWLIPKGEKPFQLTSYYPPHKPLFTDEFKTIFLEKYEFRGQTRYYDLWFCKDRNS